jgi:hypothetical protein
MSNQPMPPPKKQSSWKIATGVLIAIVILMGAVIGVLLMGNTGLSESESSDYTRITIFTGSTAVQEFGNYSYIFYYKVDSYHTSASDGIVVSVRGIYESIPSTVGSTQTVLDLRINVSEVYDDYVVLLVKQAG